MHQTVAAGADMVFDISCAAARGLDLHHGSEESWFFSGNASAFPRAIDADLPAGEHVFATEIYPVYQGGSPGFYQEISVTMTEIYPVYQGGSPGFYQEISVTMADMAIGGAAPAFAHSAQEAPLSLADGAFAGGGSVEWSSIPPGVSGEGEAISFNPSALTPGEYIVAAKSARCEDAFDSCTVNMYDIDNTVTSSSVESTSVNLPPFEAKTAWAFDPRKSFSGKEVAVDRHAVIFYEDAVNADFTAKDFSIKFTANMTDGIQYGTIKNALLPKWSKLDEPDSGALQTSTDFEAVCRNPEKGGVYHFGFDCDGLPRSECNVVLPLAGVSVDGIMLADIARADEFAKRVRSEYNYVRGNALSNLERWFYYSGAGDYRGRPNNTNSRTAWYYNLVNEISGTGSVATWAGVPIKIAKLSNFMVAYGAKKIGVSWGIRELMQFKGTSNDESASMSWSAGVEVANNPTAYHSTVSALVRDSWDKADGKI